MDEIEKFFDYQEALDIVNFFKDDNVEGYCNTLAEGIIDFTEKHNDLGIVPVVENAKYDYLMVDYGFAIWALIKFVRTYARNALWNGDIKGLVAKIEDDYLKDNEGKTTRNGNFFIGLLTFFKLSFTQRNSFYYTRYLFENLGTQQRFFLNSVPFNKEQFKEMIGEKQFEHILEIADLKKYRLLSFGMGLSNFITKEVVEQGKTTQMYNLWSPKTGLSDLVKKED